MYFPIRIFCGEDIVEMNKLIEVVCVSKNEGDF
jgi:hypothetical protein